MSMENYRTIFRLSLSVFVAAIVVACGSIAPAPPPAEPEPTTETSQSRPAPATVGDQSAVGGASRAGGEVSGGRTVDEITIQGTEIRQDNGDSSCASCTPAAPSPQPEGQVGTGSVGRHGGKLAKDDDRVLASAQRMLLEDKENTEQEQVRLGVLTASNIPASGKTGQDAAIYSAPDEELWIIAAATGTAGEASTSVEDDAPGTGAMVARLMDPSTEPAAAPTEIPLPLEHSEVRAEIAGYISTVDVTQQFHNPFSQKIEAVYFFPLPEKAAVNEFVMTIGERKIRGILREREEAEKIYAEARAQGYRASLMTQHRPNVFSQKVANIEPGNRIDVNVKYFHTLSYRDGWYEFVFPTVVGPRYNPPGHADPIHAWSTDSPAKQPASGSAIRYLRPEQRSGHDINISVDIDAGVNIAQMHASHEIVKTATGPTSTRVTLASQSTIPNKDFVLAFQVAGERIASQMLTYKNPDTGEGYFTLMVYPPAELRGLQRQSMEMVFVIDCSGSMSGKPLSQAKAAILSGLDHLEPGDTFQVIRFSDQASQFGNRPVAANANNLAAAKKYVRRLGANGGTQMIRGLRQALDFAHDPSRFRVVTFLTDGYIGNDREILGEVRKRVGDARIFSFGVGSSVNRFLLERMASEGRGAAAFLGLQDSATDIMDLYFERISHPAMTHLQMDWKGMQVSETYPARLPDLFVGRPAVITGKYTGEAGSVGIHGRAGQQELSLQVESKAQASGSHQAIPMVWARRKIADLADRQNLSENPAELAQVIRETALRYQLMSHYTSFIAVDSTYQTAGNHGTTVHQALPVPEGVRYDTTVGSP